MPRRWLAPLALVLVLGACSGAAGDMPTAELPPTTTTTFGPATTAETSTTTTAAPTTTTIPPRVVHEQAWTPFATVGGVVLVHPSARVERVAFHESNHEGARDLEPLPTAAGAVTLESRERGTGPRTAADVVVDPDVEIRAPVTGVVKRAGGYTLYCDHRDDFAVFEPDDHPGWEVKILHIDGVVLRAGDRVVAGQTLVAPRPTRLPFESQVDEIAPPQSPWPHVHIEVVDPSIPNKPSPGGGC